MAKRELVRLPGNFDEALADLLKVKPPPKGTKQKRQSRPKNKTTAKSKVTKNHKM
jgi:hypothetical protein